MLKYALALLTVSANMAAQPLAERIEQVLAGEAASKALWGVVVVDLASGAVLYERNAGLPMTPASNMKLLTTAVALRTFGAEHRFQTRVIETAGGDVVLLGGADPTISGRIYPYVKEGSRDPREAMAELAKVAAGNGLVRVRGDLIGDDSLHEHEPWADGWAVGDMAWEYGAGVSALTYNDNSVALSIRPGKAHGDPARILLRPAAAWMTIHNTLRTEQGARREIRVDRQPGSGVVTVWGTAPPGAGGSGQLIAVDDPARFAAEAFKEALAEQGVAVAGQVRVHHRAPGEEYREPEGRVVAVRNSPPLGEIVEVVNKVSQNLHAELLLREVGRKVKGRGSRTAGAEAVEEWLVSLGVGEREMAVADGSGLSRPALVSPRAVVAALRSMAAGADAEVYWRSLPVAGVDGTLASRFRGLGDVSAIRAKTGTIRHVAALSGYAGAAAGSRVAFSIIVNHATAPSQEIRAAIDRIGVAILESRKQ